MGIFTTMRYRIILIIVSSVFWTQLFAQIDGTTNQVLVIERGTGKPLPYAAVCWQNLAGGNTGHSITNELGFAKLDNIQGQMLVAVSCLGYKTFLDTLKFGQNITVEMAEDIFNLDQVTVTGTRTPRSLKETPILTQLVTRRDIQSTSALTVKDVLEMEIPSIEMGQHGGGATLKTQGLEGKYTLVLIDGERMAGETDGNVDFSRISAVNIEQVEIVRGAGSALYGSNALGSVINIITKKPGKSIDVAIDLQYAEQNQQNNSSAEIATYEDQYLRTFYRNQDRPNLNGNVSIGFKNSQWYTNSFFGFKSEDAFKLFNTKGQTKYFSVQDSMVHEEVSSVPTEVNGFRDYTLSNKSGYKGAVWSAEIRGSYYNHEEFDFSRNGSHDLYTDYTLGGFGERKIGNRSALRLSFNHDVYGKYDHSEKNGENSLNYENGFDNAKLIFNGSYKTRHAIQTSLEFQHEYLKSAMFVANSNIYHDISDVVVVLQDEFSVTPSVGIVASLRSGYNSVYGENFTPSVTIRSVHGFWNYRLTYGQGFRSPTLKELYSEWSHLGMFTIYGNKDLKTETSNFFSFSTDYVNTNRKLNATLIASYNHLSQKINGYWSENQSEFHYSNFERWRVFSTELLARWRVVPRVQLKAGYVYYKVFESSERVKQAAICPHSVTTQAEYTLKKGRYELVANLSGRITGPKDVSELDAGNNQFYHTSYPVYSLWNLNLYHRLGEHFAINTGVKNLFNYKAPIVTFNTSTSVGRRFYVSVAYDF